MATPGRPRNIMDARTIQAHGDLLRAFLEERDQEKSDRLLGELICDHAQPVIRRVLSSRLLIRGGGIVLTEQQDFDDLVNDVTVRLLNKLNELKRRSDAQSIAFRSYVAASAYNACNEYLRRKYPERSRLKDKLRYIFTHHDRLALWFDGEDWLCGFVSWQECGRSSTSSNQLRKFRYDSGTAGQSGRNAAEERGSRALIRMLLSLVEFAGEPTPFEDLIDVVADLLCIRGKEPLRASESDVAGYRDTSPRIEDILCTRSEQQAFLRRVWLEIRGLPVDQRTALLLNLKDGDGTNITSLFASSCITTMREIADALGLTADQLCDIWDKLPMRDVTIAGRLGISAQQVVSLRQSARRRLLRRMQTVERGAKLKINAV